ncbi:MAG: Eco57I restriction-modification methylase domain-containing protein [Chitinophagales bacterium]|nr:Eco57I restriction-modification methylase domain-containing protein [Chitinophagales bacterium]
MDKTPFSLQQALNKAYLKEKVARPAIENFKNCLRILLSNIDLEESEANVRDHLRDFLNDAWYKNDFLLASKERTDLVIHAGKTAKSPAAVLLEVKRPKNAGEMTSVSDLNRKALQELVLYYLRERIENENHSIKSLIITDIHQWFIFEEKDFERYFYHHKKLVEYYHNAKAAKKNTDLIYKTIGADFLPGIVDNLSFTYFNLKDYTKIAFDQDNGNDHKLIPLYKGISPVHLLKLPFANDSNSLDKGFYHELLHLIGLEETKEGGKKVITRKKDRHPGSMLENVIATLETEDCLRRLPNARQYGDTREEQLFNVGLELVIIWMNRLLFLKLLEAQLLSYQEQNPEYRFLNFDRIKDFDELNELFFDVLAKKPASRPADVQARFEKVPYLNSSLFEIADLESQTLRINSLKDRLTLPLATGTVLKDNAGKKRTGQLRTLEYLFQFLDAYDFSSEGAQEIQEEGKTLINAAVLGLIFEKLNGYKDGSFFTPGFITMYMCRETIRRAVVNKFNDQHGWNCADFDDLKNHLIDRRSRQEILESNAVIHSLRICDPAVGSGHFLVSALNEIIAIKSELRILADASGLRLPVDARVENDELILTWEDGFFSYRLKNGQAPAEMQRIQESLFHEKQRIIEHCLFGVDINPNSVKICRLRLWIELLKNAYFTAESKFRELETLPNIDINIKQGNSLVSRFALDADLSKALKSLKYDIQTYRGYVRDYHRATDKDVKQGLLQLINQIKSDFQAEIHRNDPLLKKKAKLGGELFNLTQQGQLFGLSEAETKKQGAEIAKISAELEKLDAQIEEIRANAIFRDAFEWRFEFPEVLDDEGVFRGFDCLVGNPPYIRQEELTAFKPYFQKQYETFSGTADLYVYFVERGMQVLRPGGQFSYILPNKWMRAGYGDKLRQYVKQRRIVAIRDFGDLPVFEEATTYPCVFEMENRGAEEQFTAAQVQTLDFPDGLHAYLREHEFEVQVSGLQDSGWTLSNQAVQQLLDKLRQAGKPLGEYVEGKIYYGIKTGLNEAFVIDAATRERLITEDPKSAEVIKPFLAGRDIKRYQSPKSDKYLIFTRRGIQIEEYPAILQYLLQFKERLLPRPKNNTDPKWPGRKPGSYQWYEIQDAVDYWREFEKAKILWPGISLEANSFAFDESFYYGNDNNQLIISDDKFLLGILNSKVSRLFLENVCDKVQAGFVRLKIIYVESIPIPINVTSGQKEQIISLVTRILALKRADKDADTSALEAEVDALVYGLYGLTEAEVGLVEGGVKHGVHLSS